MDERIVEKPFAVDSGEMLSKAFGSMNQRHDDYFVVMDGKKYAGVVDSRVLRDFFADPAKTKAHSVAAQPPILSMDDSDEEVVRKLLATRTKVLPVLDSSGHVVGVVTRWKALSLLEDAPQLHGKKVAEVMSSSPVTIGDSATIAQARHAMKKTKVFRLVVLNPKGAPVGMLSAFDLATRVASESKDARRQYFYFPTPNIRIDEAPVESVMTTPLQTVSVTESASAAVRKLQASGGSSLVVMDGAKLAGIVTARDLFNAVLVPEMANVRFLGLSKDEHIFKTSLEQLATRYWDKLAARVDLQPDDELIVDVKSKNVEGKKREYLVKSRLTVKGRVYASTPKDWEAHQKNWDLQQAIRESLDELVRVVTR